MDTVALTCDLQDPWSPMSECSLGAPILHLQNFVKIRRILVLKSCYSVGHVQAGLSFTDIVDVADPKCCCWCSNRCLHPPLAWSRSRFLPVTREPFFAAVARWGFGSGFPWSTWRELWLSERPKNKAELNWTDVSSWHQPPEHIQKKDMMVSFLLRNANPSSGLTFSENFCCFLFFFSFKMSEMGDGCEDVWLSSRSEQCLFRSKRRKQERMLTTVKVVASVSIRRTLKETLIQLDLQTSEQLRPPAGLSMAAAARHC